MKKVKRSTSPGIQVSGGVSEDGIPVGNTFDKYGSSNPIVRQIMRGFDHALGSLVRLADPGSIHEIGCGEGYWSLKWAEEGISVRGSDFSEKVITMAQDNARDKGLSDGLFQVMNIYDLDPGRDSADLLVCCEVLEHLENPERALEVLKATARKDVILSVPREPIWSFMNMARGRYWGDLGNTPGHIQRWSQREFIALVSRYFMIQEVRAPLPWTMLLCTK